MGLCKCPKKKVTNLFCFEHRVNVCEHCLVTNHPRCIVQSYLQWLQDSDFDPNCMLCSKALIIEEFGECIRLVCYDVFHWECLNTYCRKLPSNTAPAGYGCPMCEYCIFPPSNLISPVAETLRGCLNQVNWARAGLGLPLIDEPYTPSDEPAPGGPRLPIRDDGTKRPAETHIYSSPVYNMPPTQTDQTQLPPPTPQQSVINVDDTTPYTRGAEKAALDSRKLFDTTTIDDPNMGGDHDEDKYKRRPALQWFARWFSNRSPTNRKNDPNATFKRFVIIIILGIIGFITVLVIFMKIGRAAADNDPFLDPMANPNIRVAEQ